jgi:hypothetical protein
VRQVSITLALDGLDADAVEGACFAAGALALGYTDQRDDAILEPAPGENPGCGRRRDCRPCSKRTASIRHLSPHSAAQIGCDVARLEVAAVGERAWEREWLRDFVPLRCGEKCFGSARRITPSMRRVRSS